MSTIFSPVRWVLALAVTVTVGATLSAQSSVEREMVVSVVDRDGQPVAGLTPSDFIVREDGAPREVLRVGPAPDGRQIALLVDTSQAAGPVIGDIRRGVEAFIDAMAEGNEIALISFGGIPRILTDATSSPAALREGAGAIFSFPQAASYLLDAVRETAEGFERRNAERPVMVVLTTLGIDYSRRDARSLVDRLVETGTAFYSMVLVQALRGGLAAAGDLFDDREIEERRLERDRLLALGAERTGGRMRELQSASATEQAMRDLAAVLRGQYLIVYSRPDTLIPPERIDVESARDDLEARGTPVRGEG